MSKKQFIRHLEFYGFPDQNAFKSDIDIPSTEGKADKKDLDALSGKTEQFMSAQTAFNNAQELFNEDVVETLSAISIDIKDLKDIDDEFATQLSALTEGVNSLNEEFEDFSGDTTDAIETLGANVEELIVKSDTYALKENTYTKEEVDGLITSGASGYATVEWVLEQGYVDEGELEEKLEPYATKQEVKSWVVHKGFITVDSADTRYAGIEEFIEVSDTVSSNTEAIDDLYQIKAEKTDVETLSGVVNEISDEISTLSGNTEDITEKINFISGAVDTVDEVVHTLDEKIDNEISRSISAETALDGRVTTVEGKVNSAITIVESFDERITTVENEANSAVTIVEGYDERIRDLETGLTNEISNRETADIALIGNEGDYDTANTIFGAKAYAKEMKRQAIDSATTYTNSVVNGFNAELANLEDEMNLKFSSAATTGYVDSRINNVKRTLRGETDTKVEAEKDRAEVAESNLLSQIIDINESISAITSGVSINTSRINAITSWQGTDPEQYDYSGNGILDELHREVHSLTPQGFDELKAQVSANTEAITLKANSVDVYTKEEADNKFLTEEAISGLASTEYVNSEIARVEEEIPSIENLATKEELEEALSGKADSDSVYTQEEVDALLAEKEAEYNRLKEMILDLYYVNTFSIPADSTLDSMLRSKNGEAKLTEDVTTGTIAAGVTAKNIVKLNLGGKTVTFTGDTTTNPALMFRNKQQINIGGSGTIDAGGRIAVEANGTDCEVTLSGTMFGRPTYITDRSGGELIYCYLGTINITDGIFKNLGADKTYLLNCYDANYKNGTAKIIVTGGKFYDFNPADNSAEGEHTSFVPEGYHVETSTDGDSTVYTVKKD